MPGQQDRAISATREPLITPPPLCAQRSSNEKREKERKNMSANLVFASPSRNSYKKEGKKGFAPLIAILRIISAMPVFGSGKTTVHRFFPPSS